MLKENTPKPVRVLVSAGVRFVDDDGPALAGYLAFIGTLGLAPFLLFIATVMGFFGATEAGTHFVAFLLENMPPELSEVYAPLIIDIFQDQRTGLLTLSMITTLWVAGSAIEGIRVAVNRAYKIGEPRSYWYRRAQGFAIVLVLSVFLIGLSVALVLGPILWESIDSLVTLPDALELVWPLFRLGVTAVLMLIVMCALYYLLPNRRPTWRGVFPGAFIVLVLSLIASSLFSLYLDYLGNYAAVYGSLAGVIVSLIFMYVLGVIFVFGAEINAVIEDLDMS